MIVSTFAGADGAGTVLAAHVPCHMLPAYLREGVAGESLNQRINVCVIFQLTHRACRIFTCLLIFRIKWHCSIFLNFLFLEKNPSEMIIKNIVQLIM